MSCLPLSRLFVSGRADDHPVAIRAGEVIPFARFRADVAAAANTLQDCRRAALFCRDAYTFAVGLFGLLHAGAEVILPANGQPGTLAALVGQYDRLIGDDLLDWMTGAATLGPLVAERMAVHFFTSGSTGAPKRIVKSIGMLEREAATLDAAFGEGLGLAPVLATVTHQHLYGLAFRLCWPLSSGRPFVAENHDVWESLLAVTTEGAVVVSSPAHLGRLGGIAPLPPERRPARIFSAGVPLSAAAAAETAVLFACLPTEIFGSTESGAIATRRQQQGDEPWCLFPGNELRTDAEGRLSVRTPYVEDWLETGDLVEPWPGGFRHRGRVDRVVKIEGKRVALAEVEQALVALPWISAAVAVLLPGDPPRLAAVVVPSPAGRERLTALGGFRFGRLLRQGLADTQEPAGMPRLWRFVEVLPSHPMGKHSSAEMVALFAEKQT